jgi:hypothetical protein
MIPARHEAVQLDGLAAGRDGSLTAVVLLAKYSHLVRESSVMHALQRESTVVPRYMRLSSRWNNGHREAPRDRRHDRGVWRRGNCENAVGSLGGLALVGSDTDTAYITEDMKWL